ncbi:hypothetical protein CSKR_110312 [Clonorchis sinensis]|uniref:Uncharacterized protein n=1 Tax=Clonorchis sinensis TaxID=79923 RepID=A0A3R7CNY5_CLOSI|nr:hypothetical protein CSKR_110312 [Clonorchis sinensis]
MDDRYFTQKPYDRVIKTMCVTVRSAISLCSYAMGRQIAVRSTSIEKTRVAEYLENLITLTKTAKSPHDHRNLGENVVAAKMESSLNQPSLSHFLAGGLDVLEVVSEGGRKPDSYALLNPVFCTVKPRRRQRHYQLNVTIGPTEVYCMSVSRSKEYNHQDTPKASTPR